MIVLFRTLGILAVAAGFLWMVIAELILKESRGGEVRFLLLFGVALLVLSLLLSTVGKVTAKVVGRRCPRCSRPVQHGHVYCADHRKETVNQIRDYQQRKGEGE